MVRSVEEEGGDEAEHADLGVEVGAVVAGHVEGAGHGAGGGGEGAEAGVFEALAGVEAGSFADDAGSADVFAASLGVANDPVAGAESGGLVALVGDAHAVGEDELSAVGVGALGEVVGVDLDADPVGGGVRHD